MAVQTSRTYADVNAVVGGYLRDLAFAQSSQQKMFGYKRAAAAILALDVPLTDLVGPTAPCRGSLALVPVRHASSGRFLTPAGRPPSSARSTPANAAPISSGGVNFGAIF